AEARDAVEGEPWNRIQLDLGQKQALSVEGAPVEVVTNGDNRVRLVDGIVAPSLSEGRIIGKTGAPCKVMEKPGACVGVVGRPHVQSRVAGAVLVIDHDDKPVVHK